MKSAKNEFTAQTNQLSRLSRIILINCDIIILLTDSVRENKDIYKYSRKRLKVNNECFQ